MEMNMESINAFDEIQHTISRPVICDIFNTRVTYIEYVTS